jgi:hypothetical protein
MEKYILAVAIATLEAARSGTIYRKQESGSTGIVWDAVDIQKIIDSIEKPTSVRVAEELGKYFENIDEMENKLISINMMLAEAENVIKHQHEVSREIMELIKFC